MRICRPCLLPVFFVCWGFAARAAMADPATDPPDLKGPSRVGRTIKVTYDRGHLNLEKRYLEVAMSRPAGRAELRVIGESGNEVGSGQATFHGEPPGTWVRIPWEEKSPETVLQLDLRLYDRAGQSVHLLLTPWSVNVPHDEVNFATASYEIEPAQRGKLDESYRRIQDKLGEVKAHVKPRLFVAGHTDTVGSDADNLVLSRNRARAIATYLHDKGLDIPILYAGCGERMLRVQTGDSVDEPRNRRSDYTLAVDPPRLPAGISWQRLE